MGELEPKTILVQDWLTIIFLFCFCLITILKFVNPIKFNYLINTNYSKIYKKNPFNIFNIISCFFIIIIFSKHLFFVFRNNKIVDNEFIYLLYIFFAISSVVVSRTFIIILFFKIYRYGEFFKNLINGNLNIFFKTSIILFFLMTFNLYALNSNHKFNIVISILIFINLFYSQFSLIWNTFKEHKPTVFLLILYICILKISPWMIIYSLLFI